MNTSTEAAWTTVKEIIAGHARVTGRPAPAPSLPEPTLARPSGDPDVDQCVREILGVYARATGRV